MSPGFTWRKSGRTRRLTDCERVRDCSGIFSILAEAIYLQDFFGEAAFAEAVWNCRSETPRSDRVLDMAFFNSSCLLIALAALCTAQSTAIFPSRAATPVEIVGNKQIAAELSAIETRALETLSATDFGVRCDGTTDDTKAATAALNAAWATGKTLRFPAGDCLMGNISLPAPSSTVNRTLSFMGTGSGIWFGGQNPKFGGTRFIFTKADGSDFMVANSTAYADPTYEISDISLYGPDTWHGGDKGDVASTTKSGSGLKFVGKAVPRLYLHNISIQGFYGPGTAGLWVSNAEDSSLYEVHVDNVNSCAHFSEAFNASTVVNFECQNAMNDGVFITDSGSLTWLGGLFQTNRMTGLHIKGMVASSFTSVHFENNDWSATTGEGAIKIEAVYSPGCPKPGDCLSNQNLVFTGDVFNAPTDRIVTLGGGPGGWSNANITMMNGYANGVATPFVTLNDYSYNWRIVGIIGSAPSAASRVSDAGAGNVILVGNSAVALHDGNALSALGNAGVAGDLTVGGDGSFPSLKAKSGTRFICVDTTGKLLSQATPCSGT